MSLCHFRATLHEEVLMETSRRNFLMLALAGAVLATAPGPAIAEDAAGAGDAVRLTLAVPGMT
jgi:hypothetical protein